MYTLDLDLSQLERVQDRITAGAAIRIIHILTEDRTGFAGHYEDRYIVLIDCAPETYTLLCLI